MWTGCILNSLSARIVSMFNPFFLLNRQQFDKKQAGDSRSQVKKMA